MYSTDVCVPLSQLPTLVADTQQDFKDNKIFGSVLGHAAVSLNSMLRGDRP